MSVHPLARSIVLFVAAPIALLLGLLVAPATAAETPATATAPQKASAFRYKDFMTPSQNIRCAGVKSSGRWQLRCDIIEHYWVAPYRQCDFGDYGSSVGMGKRRWSSFICVSDAISPNSILYYGEKWKMGPFKCKSRTKGLRCKNKRKHGWFLSRESYRLF